MSYVDFHVTHPLWLLAIPLKVSSHFALPYFVSASNRVMLSYLLCENHISVGNNSDLICFHKDFANYFLGGIKRVNGVQGLKKITEAASLLSAKNRILKEFLQRFIPSPPSTPL